MQKTYKNLKIFMQKTYKILKIEKLNLIFYSKKIDDPCVTA